MGVLLTTSLKIAQPVYRIFTAQQQPEQQKKTVSDYHYIIINKNFCNYILYLLSIVQQHIIDTQ